ncbi:copper resistance CopC/CopD family protein [Aureimonas sp. AU12]|uniref:copper resistance CopC/CopD family protein n=1 Tax=Aureimonas sp. AU12 TaxID=1638161 RepID=UPI000780EE54|nr:copper resistance CopC/CopD family protein [Aureimonas sp. AU12]
MTRTIPSAGLRALAILAIVLAVVSTGVVGTASRASAHAALVASQPSDGAVLAMAPARFDLRFSEAVSPLTLRLVAPDGTVTVLGGAELRDGALAIPAPAGLTDGTHVLSWRVVSKDGHPVGGSVVFSIGAASTGGAPVVAEVDRPIRAFVWTTKLMLYLGLVFGVGGLASDACIRRLGGGARNIVRSALLLGLAAAPLAIGAQGLDALGASLGALGQPAVWQAGASTSFGRTVAFSATAFLLALLALALRRQAARRAVTALALLAIGWALAASGHAGSASPQWLTRPAVFVHALAVAAWIGALVPLCLALRGNGPSASASLRRFSSLIPWVVAALFASGLILAIIQIGTPAALWETAYGRVLLVKLALLGVLFALAGANRWRWTGPTLQGEAIARRRLVRSLAAEIVVAVLVLGTVALWRFTPPPRAIVIAAAQPASVHAMSARVMADLTVTPGHTGPVVANVSLMTIDYGPVDPRQVTFVFSNPLAGIEPIRRAAEKPGDGTWQADLSLPVPGRWAVRIDVLVDDFVLERIEGEIDLRP